MKRNILIIFLTLIIFFSLTTISESQTETESLQNRVQYLEHENKELYSLVNILNERLKVYKDNENSIMMLATAYDRSETGNNKTATGTKTEEYRTCAIDPRVVPIGSLVYIESNYPGISGEYIACDTGGDIKRKRIDIFIDDSHTKEFGKRWVKVRIISRGVY